MLSRSCNAEQALIMSLGNREGKASDEAEPEELPDYSPLRSCERQDGALQELFTLFCLYAQKSVFYFAFIFLTRETRSARSEKLKI